MNVLTSRRGEKKGRPVPGLSADLCLDSIVGGPTGGECPFQGMIVVAHPDDETIGLGLRLRQLKKSWLVHVTDGSPRNLLDASRHGFANHHEYARARQLELVTALRLAGFDPARNLSLGFPDQESTFYLHDLIERLAARFLELQPRFLLTHSYEGGHPDHDTTALAVHIAALLFSRSQGRLIPILEFAGYHAGETGIRTGNFLPPENRARWLNASPAEQALKKELFTCFKTQQQTLSLFPIDREGYRAAPQYDFARPPHLGRLYYENFDWGMTGERWREMTAPVLRKHLNRAL